MGPDRNRHIRNVLIIVALALAVWLLPGGDTGSNTIYNILTVLLTAGLLFFAFRLYMEHRATIFGLEDRQRGILYAAVALAAFALIATSKLWDEGGLGALLWFGLIALAGVRDVHRVAHVPGVLRNNSAGTPSLGVIPYPGGPVSAKWKSPIPIAGVAVAAALGVPGHRECRSHRAGRRRRVDGDRHRQ